MEVLREAAACLGQNGLLGEKKMLRHIADTVTARDGYFAGIRLFLPYDYTEQRGLAVAVAPDKADALLWVYTEADIVKQELPAE